MQIKLATVWGQTKIGMLKANLYNSQVYSKFFQPLDDLMPACKHQRGCPEVPDLQWLQLGVGRVLMESNSGRGFLQQHGAIFGMEPAYHRFFDALRSPRRKRLVAEMNQVLVDSADSKLNDPWAAFPELANFDIYAGDGHWHGAGAHDSIQDGRKYPTGHFFSLNLRTHTLSHLAEADQEARKHEHDMRALKRQTLDELRQGACKGRKVLYAWDSACLNYEQWDYWKKRGGIYFITRIKKNLQFELHEERPIDPSQRVNRGVLVDQIIQPSGGGRLRLIECEDPETGRLHVFITNELTLSPGLLVQIYRMRWNIEKVFDMVKNSLCERKAWASSATAKTMQAQFVCLTHNLLLLFEELLFQEHGVKNQAEEDRRHQRLQRMEKLAKKGGREISAVYYRVWRMTKRSLKFIRTLRQFLIRSSPVELLAAQLQQLYSKL